MTILPIKRQMRERFTVAPLSASPISGARMNRHPESSARRPRAIAKVIRTDGAGIGAAFFILFAIISLALRVLP